MDYLRTLGSAAASSILQKSGISLPFSLGDKVSYFDGKGIWTLYDATKRDDQTPVSVFFFDANQPGRRAVLPLAKNALRKLRTVRHPDVLKFIDVVETETTIHIVTERVQPLGKALAAWASKSGKSREDWLIWGLHRISIAIAFVNESCQSTHGNVRVDSVFISPSGEWKLGGFEVLSNAKEDNAVLFTVGHLPEAKDISSPEVKKGKWVALKEHPPSTLDSYSLGLFIHSIFNPSHPPPPTSQPPHPPPAASSRGAIPPSIFPSYKRLLHVTIQTRLSPKGFLDIGMGEVAAEGSGFFRDNRLVQICNGLDGFSLGNDHEKASLLKTLKDSSDSFPNEFTSHKVLPSLLHALEFGGASAASILPLALQLGKNVAPSEYSTLVLGPVVKLFASPDRGTRMALLDSLGEFAERLDGKMVVDKVWPHLQTGFSDTVAVIREATVRSIILISSKLTDRILNNDLLRNLAKAQLDTEPSIRTNTCILLGRLAPNLGPNTKRKVLIPAFSRALKDPFVHARVAGLMALMATVECYDVEDLAGKVVPAMSFSLVDKEKLVRDQAFKAIELFVKKIEAHAATMPHTVLTNENGDQSTITTPIASSSSAQAATVVSSAAGAAGALAGWAVSSITRKLAVSDMQSAMNTTTAPAASVPSSSALPSKKPSQTSPFSSTSTSTFTSKPAAKTMKLASTKVSGGVDLKLVAELEEDAAEFEGAWGDVGGNGEEDLMDVNADADDWSAFESAPTPEIPAASPPAPDPRPAPPPVIVKSNGVSQRKETPGAWDDAFDETDDFPLSPSSQRSTFSPPSQKSPAVSDGGTPPQALSPIPTGMSKEEKAAEIVRKREERKQRIAQLKEQKKSAGGAGKA